MESGALRIEAGGQVSASTVSVASLSLLAIDVATGSQLAVNNGAGAFTNNGTVRIIAGPGAGAGSQYSPIAAATWSGSGAYQALGGTWNATSHVFTVSQTLTSVSGLPMAFNLADLQRVLVNDGQGGAVGTSFLAKTGASTDINFTASVVSGDRLTALQKLVEPGQTLLSAWDLTATGSGYSASDPFYLSFGVGQGYSRSDLQVWRFDGNSWSSDPATDLTCNDGYASFTSTGLSTYAISAVPEPSTVAMLLTITVGGLLWWKRRRA